jgi:hypothetical protein
LGLTKEVPMGTYALHSLESGMRFGWGFLDSKQKEIVMAALRIINSLSDEKILELGKKGTKPKEAK